MALARSVEIVTDERVIESANIFEGKRFSVGDSILKRPDTWPKMWNPFRPSWGEPYKAVVARMMAAVHDARDAARGHEALVVSHQLPVWVTRLHVENRSLRAQPAQPPVHAVQRDVAGLRGRPARRRCATPSRPPT